MPEYPVTMGYSGYRGRVLLEFVVDEKGVPRDPKVISSNHPDFEQAAVAALLKWRFEPGKKAGKAIAARVRQTLIFEIAGDWPSANPFSVSRRAPDSVPEEFRYDKAPEVDLMVTPAYPRELAVAGVTGFAEVSFVVDAKGRATRIEVGAASCPEFGAALAAAVDAWRFDPARKEGQPWAALLKYRHEFESDDAKSGSGARLLAKLKKDGAADLPSLAELDRVPNALFRAAPVYPERLRAAGVEGEVRVRFIIDREGMPRFPVALGATHEALGWAAVTAVRRQRYEAPRKDGKPVDAWAVLPLKFALAD